MNIILCLDDNMGMLFNGKRQSRDKCITEDIEKTIDKIWIHPFSEDLFLGSNCNYQVSETFLDQVGKQEYCFVEAHHIASHLQQVNQIIIYRWNRKYPSDFKCDIPLNQWYLAEQHDLKGFSHERITKEVYTRG